MYKVTSEGKHPVLFCCTLHAKNESVSSSKGNVFKCNYLELFAAKSPLPVVECSDFCLCRMPGLKPTKGQTKCWPYCSSGLCNLVEGLYSETFAELPKVLGFQLLGKGIFFINSLFKKNISCLQIGIRNPWKGRIIQYSSNEQYYMIISLIALSSNEFSVCMLALF